MEFLSKTLRSFIAYLKSKQFIKSLIYDLTNKEDFSDLYEHEKMLADSTRINTYYEGIKKFIKKGDVVVDLGTGTGILSFLASKQEPKTIYAIDQSEFIDVAKDIALHNKIDNIEFVHKNSREFEIDAKADVIIQEQMGEVLFNENMIENILDLKKRVLKNGGIILPGKYEFFIEPAFISGPIAAPFIWEQKIHGIDFSFLKDNYNSNNYKKEHYEVVFKDSGTFEYYLSEPSPILTFDLNTMEHKEEIPTRHQVSRVVQRAGNLNAFVIYFRTIFDEEIHFTIAPNAKSTSWVNMFFRTKTQYFNKGDELRYEFNMTNLMDLNTWSLHIKE